MKDKFLTAEEVKKLERIAGTSCHGTVCLQYDGKGHTELQDDYGIAAYMDATPEEILKKIRKNRNDKREYISKLVCGIESSSADLSFPQRNGNGV